ncbi:MAG: hypothetical protein LBR56_01955 [Sporomusaceae bacterium]|jgi:hypothetical protein|nr:hypothetical protein [Sporomusaceae bacterium]
MNYFKEYDDTYQKMSRWLPWACLVSPGVVENKDGSFVGAFLYTEKKSGDNPAAIKIVREVLRAFGSGWVWWTQRRYTPEGVQNHIALSWNPRLENGCFVNYPRVIVNLPKDHADPKLAFIYALNWLEKFLNYQVDIRQLRDLELLQFLHDTVTPDITVITMPEIPLYLDALLSQNNSYNISNSGLRVNNIHVKIISLLGFMDDGRELFAFLENFQYKYRFVRRLVFFSREDACKEAKRYMNGWCEERKSILTALDYSYNVDKVYGYFTNTLILWNEGLALLQEICCSVQLYLENKGILSIIEEPNQVDVWLGSLPAMFRCNITPPLLELDDAAALLL